MPLTTNGSVYFRDVRGLIIEKSTFKGRLLSEYLKSFNLMADIVDSETEALDDLTKQSYRPLGTYREAKQRCRRTTASYSFAFIQCNHRAF